MQKDIHEILASYGVDQVESIKEVIKGLINKTFLIIPQRGEKLILQKIRSTSKKSLDQQIKLQDFLFKMGFPVSVAKKTIDNSRYVFCSNRYWVLYSYIDHNITNKKNTESIKNAAKMLGKFHSFFRVQSGEKWAVSETPEDITQLLEKFESLLKNKNHENWTALKEAACFINTVVADHPIPDHLPKTLNHGDPKFDNFLFKNNKVVGILDLDGATFANELFDIGDAFRSWCKDDDFQFSKKKFEAALQGYLAENNQKYVADYAKSSMILITVQLSVRFFIDSFEQKHFMWDKKKYKSAREHNIKRGEDYLRYCRNIISSF